VKKKEIKERIEELDANIKSYLDIMQKAIVEEDFHLVSDSANDIREFVREKETLGLFLKKPAQ